MSSAKAIWRKAKGLRGFFLSACFLSSAFFLAVLSSMAQGKGQIYAAILLAAVALILIAFVCVTVIPKLLFRVGLDLLHNFRFFRLTRTGILFVIATLIISFASLKTGNNLLILVLSLLLASMVTSGIMANLVLYGLKISVSVPDEIYAGQQSIFEVSLHNLKNFFPSFALKLKGGQKSDWGTTDFFLKENSFPYVKANGKVKMSLVCQFMNRGTYSVEGFEIRTTFPFGLFWRGRSLEARGTIVIYPELQDLMTLFLQRPYLQGREQTNRSDWGCELYSIRKYHSGEAARAIHWKSTAKLRRLMVKDFALDQETPVNIVLSTHIPDHSSWHLEKFEKAISYIASLANYYRMRGQEFTFTSDNFSVSVNNENQQYISLMNYLARVRPILETETSVKSFPTPCVLFVAGDSILSPSVPQIDYLQL